MGFILQPEILLFFFKKSKTQLEVQIFWISLDITCGELIAMFSTVTSKALLENFTTLNSHYRSFSKFLTKISLSGIPCCALRC